MDPSRRLASLAVRAPCAAIAMLCVVAPAVAQAAARRSLVVEVSPHNDWRADALIQTLTADLADDRLTPRSAPACSGPCGDDALRAAGIELAVRATLAADGATFGYELRALWPGAPAPVRGRIVLRGLGRAGFAGVLRDQLHRLARTTSDDSAAPDTSGAAGATSRVADRRDDAGAGDLPEVGDIARWLGLVIGILATPIALGAARRRRFTARAAALRTLVGVASLGALALVVSAIAPANGRGVLLAAGGIAWGTFAAVTVPVVLPPLVGLGRIDYSDLWRVLAAWSGLVVQRAIMVALVYAPVALGVALAGDAIGLAGGALRFALVLPLGLLVARQWVRLAIAVAAEQLDTALVDRATDVAAWQDAVRGYLVGYLRRNGLPIDDHLLDRMIVLPAAGDDVEVYGGGATQPRIAIPRRMLELALAPWGRPHDYAAPRVSTLHWTQWNAGLVMATEAGAVIATREQRQPRETTAEGDPSENAREHFGEPPTLVGIIEPTALDPRTSYRPHDDPAWLDWDSGEDHDGTDAGDRDFLFGVLVHAIAQIQRHGDRPNTVALALRRAAGLTAPVAHRLGWLVDLVLGLVLGRMSDTAGDHHAAIGGARHHLVQYLGWEAWRREDLLTARAYAPELEAMSRRVLAERAQPTSRPLPTAVRARHRLARLGAFVHGAPAASARWRRLALAGAVVAVAGWAAVAVADAVRYHAPSTDHPKSTPDTMEKPDHGKD